MMRMERKMWHSKDNKTLIAWHGQEYIGHDHKDVWMYKDPYVEDVWVVEVKSGGQFFNSYWGTIEDIASWLFGEQDISMVFDSEGFNADAASGIMRWRDRQNENGGAHDQNL